MLLRNHVAPAPEAEPQDDDAKAADARSEAASTDGTQRVESTDHPVAKVHLQLRQREAEANACRPPFSEAHRHRVDVRYCMTASMGIS